MAILQSHHLPVISRTTLQMQYFKSLIAVIYIMFHWCAVLFKCIWLREYFKSLPLQYFRNSLICSISNGWSACILPKSCDCSISNHWLTTWFQIIRWSIHKSSHWPVFQIIQNWPFQIIDFQFYFYETHWLQYFKSLICSISQIIGLHSDFKSLIAPISQIIDCSIDQIIVLQYFEEFYWLSSISQISWLHAGLQNHWQSSISCIDLTLICSFQIIDCSIGQIDWLTVFQIVDCSISNHWLQYFRGSLIGVSW